MAKIGPHFEKEQTRLYLFKFFVLYLLTFVLDFVFDPVPTD